MRLWDSLTTRQRADLLDLYPDLVPVPRAATPHHLPPASLDAWQSRYLPHYFTKPPSRLHKWLDATLDKFHEKRGQRQVIEAPRGSAKSTRCSLAYPLRAALQGHERYIQIISDTIGQACFWLEAIKDECESNDSLRDAYPFLKSRPLKWNTRQIVLPNGVMIEALGTGSKIRGRRHKQYRPTLIILDDPENEDHVFSERKQEKVWRWFTRGLLSAGTPETNVIVLGTAIHPKAIVEKLKTAPGWRHQLFRSIESWPERMDLWASWEQKLFDLEDVDREATARKFYEAHHLDMDRGAVVLWPEQKNLYQLMSVRAMSHLAFEYEEQNNPTNPENTEFPEEYFNRADFWFDEWPKDALFFAMALDPSKGRDARKGDYSALGVGCPSAKGHIYIDADLQRRPISRMVDDSVAMAMRFRPLKFAVETNQFQELLQPLIEQKGAAASYPCPVDPVNNRLPKPIRIRRLEPWLRQGFLRFKRNSPGVLLLLDQLRAFPDPSAHDDGPDMLDMLIQLIDDLLSPGGRGGGERVAGRI